MTAVLPRPADDCPAEGTDQGADPSEISSTGDVFATRASSLRWIVMLAGLAVWTTLVYANGIRSPFYLDDLKILEKTPTVRTLSAAWRTQPTRRVGMVSFALNYRLHGLNITGFHLANILIHVLAGLALAALVRGTLKLPIWQGRWLEQADGWATTVAAVWLVHPLQTGAVTYTIQRFESLMAMWFLLSLLMMLIGATRTRSTVWYLCCLVAAALGAQTKEVLVVLPVVALAYDRVFLAESWRAVVTRRGWVHAGLLAISGWMLYASRAAFDPSHGGSAGLGLKNVTPWEYLSSQPGVLLRYLRLAVWPDRLCFDYLWPVARSPWEIYPAGLVIIGLLMATLWALWRRPALGFLGLCWFAILAPTSSVIPIADLAFEHRMYLPLAPLVTLAIVGGARLWLRFTGPDLPTARDGASEVNPRRVSRVSLLPSCVVGLVVVVLSLRTITRNRDYDDPTRMWSSVLTVSPHNYRAHNQLALQYEKQGRLQEAEHHFRETLAIKPDAWWVDVGLGNLRVRQGRIDEAVQHFEAARRVKAGFALGSANLARVRERQDRWDDAITLYEEALRRSPEMLEFRLALAAAYQHAGRSADAIRELRRILKRDPQSSEAARRLAELERAGHISTKS